MAAPTTTPETLNPDRIDKSGDKLQYMTLAEYASLPEQEDGYTYELVRGAVVREPEPFLRGRSPKENPYAHP